jgi:hypothetical protein
LTTDALSEHAVISLVQREKQSMHAFDATVDPVVVAARNIRIGVVLPLRPPALTAAGDQLLDSESLPRNRQTDESTGTAREKTEDNGGHTIVPVLDMTVHRLNTLQIAPPKTKV